MLHTKYIDLNGFLFKVQYYYNKQTYPGNRDMPEEKAGPEMESIELVRPASAIDMCEFFNAFPNQTIFEDLVYEQLYLSTKE